MAAFEEVPFSPTLSAGNTRGKFLCVRSGLRTGSSLSNLLYIKKVPLRAVGASQSKYNAATKVSRAEPLEAKRLERNG